MAGDKFPQRPGQPDCVGYLKTAYCPLKKKCKYHHPKNITPSECYVNAVGLPLRPGQPICPHYSRFGLCQSVLACKFDHSSTNASSSGSK
ncbi:unnamed protein product [Arabis nemorensis]|uniref:C3H1-type domain-containing protein n=1 Tax=Arabis nemorensis TaxID=586526 RepID=A0A565BH66_9BRAS|nr:unnamed protein product [Arabis nemorensis]